MIFLTGCSCVYLCSSAVSEFVVVGLLSDKPCDAVAQMVGRGDKNYSVSPCLCGK